MLVRFGLVLWWTSLVLAALLMVLAPYAQKNAWLPVLFATAVALLGRALRFIFCGD